jgi:hypothetical protein
LAEAAGARGERLPAYSPDFNPIEERIQQCLQLQLFSLEAGVKRVKVVSVVFALMDQTFLVILPQFQIGIETITPTSLFAKSCSLI